MTRSNLPIRILTGALLLWAAFWGPAPAWGQWIFGPPISVFFVGTGGGSANAYTVATPSPTNFKLVDQYAVRTTIPAANTGASTLNVGGTGAVAINRQTETGLVALAAGDLLANNQEYTFVYNASSNVWVLTTLVSPTITIGATSQTITAAQWENNRTLVVTTGAQTITLPNSASTPLGSNGGILIEAIGNSVTLQASGSDTINGGAGGSSVTLPSGSLVFVTGDGASPTNFKASFPSSSGGTTVLSDIGTGAVTVTSSTTYVNIGGTHQIALTLVSGKKYVCTGYFPGSGGAAGGAKIGLAGDGTLSVNAMSYALHIGNNSSVPATALITAGGNTGGTGSTLAYSGMVSLLGTIDVNVGGVMSVQGAQNASSGTGTVFSDRSYLSCPQQN